MSKLSSALEVFQKNTQAVLQLSDLDRGLLDHAIRSLKERDTRLLKAGVENSRMLSGSTLQNLKNIRENDSLRPGFQALVNQSVVLLVSYFASGVSQLFRVAELLRPGHQRVVCRQSTPGALAASMPPVERGLR